MRQDILIMMVAILFGAINPTDLSLDGLLQIGTIVTGLYGQVLVTNHNYKGFYLWIASNVFFSGLHILSGRPAMIMLQVVYALFCAWSVYKWKQVAPEDSPGMWDDAKEWYAKMMYGI